MDANHVRLELEKDEHSHRHRSQSEGEGILEAGERHVDARECNKPLKCGAVHRKDATSCQSSLSFTCMRVRAQSLLKGTRSSVRGDHTHTSPPIAYIVL